MKNSKLLYVFVTLCFSVVLNAETLTITKAYELSLENSNDLKSTNYQVESKKENINQVKSELYPRVNFSASHSKTDFEINHLQNRVDYEQIETSTDYTISLNQTIYNKELFSKINMEETRVKLYAINAKLQEQELAKRVLKSYLDILKSKNLINYYKSVSNHNQSKLKAVKKRFEMNLSNKMDLLEIEVEYNSSKLDLVKEKKLLDVYKLRLKQLIGDTKFDLPKVDFNTIDLTNIKQMRKVVISHNNLESNLLLKQASLGKILSAKEMENSLSGHYPKVTINAKYTKYESDDITTDYENMKRVGLQIEIPIYRGGYTSSRVISSKLMNKAANEDLLMVKKDIKIEYEELLALFDTSITTLDMYIETYKSAKLYYNSVSIGFENGLKSIVDLHDAQSKVNNVEYKYMESIHELVNNYVGLLIVTNNFEDLKLIDKILN